MLFKELPNKSDVWKEWFFTVLEDVKNYYHIKAVIYLSTVAYGEMYNRTGECFRNCNSFIDSRRHILVEELEKYLPDRLDQFDLAEFVDQLWQEACRREGVPYTPFTLDD